MTQSSLTQVYTMDNITATMIFDSIDEGIALIDEGNRLVYCNSAFRTRRETALQKIDNITVTKLYPNQNRDEVLRIINTLRSKKSTEIMHLMVNDERGRQFSDAFSIARDDYGDTAGIIIRSNEVLSTAVGLDGKTFAQKYVSKDMGEIQKDRTIKEITNRRKKEIAALLDFSYAADSDEIDAEALLDALKAILAMFSIEAGDVRNLDSKKQFFSAPLISYGLSDNFIRKITNMSIDKCLCGQACKEGKILFSSDLASERTLACPHCIEEGFRTSIAIPVYTDDEPSAILHLASFRKKAIDDEDLRLFEMISNLFALLFNQKRIVERGSLAKEYLKGIISASTDPIAILDREGIIIDINPTLERVTGLNRKSILKAPFLRLFPEVVRNYLKDLIEKSFSDEKAQEFDTFLLSAANEQIPVGLSLTMLKKPDETPMGTIAIMKDRSGEKSFQEKLKRINREFSSIYTLSHLLTQNMTIKDFTEKTLQEMSRLFDIIPRASLYELKIGIPEMQLVAGINIDVNIMEHEKVVPFGECLCSNAIESGEILVTDTPGKDLDYKHHQETWNIIIPIKKLERVTGLLILYSNKKLTLDPATMQLLVTFSNIVGAAMEKSRLVNESMSLYEKLKRTGQAM